MFIFQQSQITQNEFDKLAKTTNKIFNSLCNIKI